MLLSSLRLCMLWQLLSSFPIFLVRFSLMRQQLPALPKALLRLKNSALLCMRCTICNTLPDLNARHLLSRMLKPTEVMPSMRRQMQPPKQQLRPLPIINLVLHPWLKQFVPSDWTGFGGLSVLMSQEIHLRTSPGFQMSLRRSVWRHPCLPLGIFVLPHTIVPLLLRSVTDSALQSASQKTIYV